MRSCCRISKRLHLLFFWMVHLDPPTIYFSEFTNKWLYLDHPIKTWRKWTMTRCHSHLQTLTGEFSCQSQNTFTLPLYFHHFSFPPNVVWTLKTDQRPFSKVLTDNKTSVTVSSSSSRSGGTAAEEWEGFSSEDWGEKHQNQPSWLSGDSPPTPPAKAQTNVWFQFILGVASNYSIYIYTQLPGAYFHSKSH